MSCTLVRERALSDEAWRFGVVFWEGDSMIGAVSECLIRRRWTLKERRVGRPVTGGGGDALF
jgi:hypothetical protein